VWYAGTSSLGRAHWADAPSVTSAMERVSKTVRMVVSVSEARLQAKKTARTFWGARAGRPVTQLVLKLSTGGFHLNRSTRIDATAGRMLLTKTTFFENCRKPPRPPATWQVHSVAPSPSNQLFSACTPRAVKHLPRRDNKFSQKTICRSAESPNCQPSQPSRYLFP
jgi:hypothetical protein